ncbi:hypothetical protein BH23GEM11_BH23GEM11_01620 [soil metagenome]
MAPRTTPGVSPGRGGLLRAGARGGVPALLLFPLLFWGCGGADEGADPERGVEAVGDEVGGADTVASGPRVPPGTETVRLHLGDEGELLIAPCVDSEPQPTPHPVTDA